MCKSQGQKISNGRQCFEKEKSTCSNLKNLFNAPQIPPPAFNLLGRVWGNFEILNQNPQFVLQYDPSRIEKQNFVFFKYNLNQQKKWLFIFKISHLLLTRPKYVEVKVGFVGC